MNRRETEARILVPFLEKLCETFGKEKVVEILRHNKRACKEAGKGPSSEYGNDIDAFLKTLEFKQDGALEINVWKIKNEAQF